MIRLGQATDGRLILGANEVFPADIKHVEYYIEEHLFALVFDTPEEESRIMPCEVSKDVAAVIQSSPSLMVVAMAPTGQEPYGYTVPLIQIGV